MIRVERFHGRERPHRHERGRVDDAVRRGEARGAPGAVRSADRELEAHSLLPCRRQTIAIASPYEKNR
jgi:hypothetical protein